MWRKLVAQQLELFPNQDQKTLGAATALLLVVVLASSFFWGQKKQDKIPILGDTFYFRRFFLDSYTVVREGYQKVRPHPPTRD